MVFLNFDIASDHPISALFLARNITTFTDACTYIRNLPYGRNANKQDLTTVFSDHRGTCSTKHALLRQLATENHADHVRLILGIFKMSKQNTPAVGDTLDRYQLPYIPEAHNYLTIDREILDCTKPNSSKDDFIEDLLIEIEIEPHQITDFKISFHQAFLKEWLLSHPDILYSFDEIWRIRERCIMDLSE